MAINVNRDATGFLRALAFHDAMGITVREHVPGQPHEPSEEERILRAKLLFEETLETIRDGLGVALCYGPISTGATIHDMVEEKFSFEIVDSYDPVETLDGLADVKVIANGTAVCFGLPMEDADRIVFESNMSKLDEDGKPTINGVTPGYRTGSIGGVGEDELGYDSTKPIGKVLKGARYEPALIGSLLYNESTCPGHVAHKEDSKRCRRCGIHIDELRP